MRRFPNAGWVAATLVCITAACSDSEPMSPAGATGGAVTLSISTGSPTAPAPAPGFFSVVYGDGSNTLEMSSVRLVVREIELERQSDESCDTHVEGVDDTCESFKTGPVLVDFPTGATAEAFVTITGVPAGVYDEVEFNIHKPSSGLPDDAPFLQAHPDYAEISIRVEGQYNGTAFTYESDLMDNQEIQLTPALDIADGAPATNVTLRLDIGTWFRAADGSLVDPDSANKGGENESIVANNIKASIDAFEDRDRDGTED